MRPDQEWRINREISLPDIISFVAAVVAVVIAYTTLDKRITLLEGIALTQKEIDKRQDAESLRYQSRIEDHLREINRKLDKLTATR